MLQLDAPQVAARLGRGPLIDALMRAFQEDYQVPDRQHYAVGGPLSPKDTLLVMPAWRVGGCLGVKLVTVFPGNARRGESAVHATYALFDAVTGIPLAVLDGTELTAHLHAGHTKGATSFTLNVQEDGKTYHVIIANMASINPGVTLSGMPTFPNISQAYARTFRAQKKLKIDACKSSDPRRIPRRCSCRRSCGR